MGAAANRVGVAVVGAGNFAEQQHLPNLARLAEADLRTVCDADPARAERMRGQYGAGRACSDVREVLDDPAISVVVIAVRDHLQSGLTVDALRAGKHVYVEKPLSPTPEGCAAVVAAQQEGRGRVAVGFNRRYAPIYRAMRDAVGKGGGAFNVNLRMADDAWRWAKGYPPGHLLTLDVGHLIDLLRWMTGQEVTRIASLSSRPDDDALLLGLSGGCVATINFSGHATMDLPKERVEAVVAGGCVIAEDFVELRCFGMSDAPAVRMFAGHTHPEGEYLHKPLFAELGLAGLRAVRRSIWELRADLEREGRDAEPDGAEARRFVDRMVPNFMRDQGWLASVRAFLIGLQRDEPTDHATPADALAAARVTAAALHSRETGTMMQIAPL